jgi:hypothetical protein
MPPFLPVLLFTFDNIIIIIIIIIIKAVYQ